MTIFAIVSQANTLEVEENAIVVPTFESLINEHVRLFIFKKKSDLCGLIRDCAFINFDHKSFHKM